MADFIYDNYFSWKQQRVLGAAQYQSGANLYGGAAGTQGYANAGGVSREAAESIRQTDISRAKWEQLERDHRQYQAIEKEKRRREMVRMDYDDTLWEVERC